MYVLIPSICLQNATNGKRYYSGAGPRQKRKCSSMSRTDGASDIRHDPAHCNALPSTLQQGKLGCGGFEAATSMQNQVAAGQSVSVGNGKIANEAMGFYQTRAEDGQNVEEVECSQLTVPTCCQPSPCKRMKIELKQELQRLEQPFC